MKHNAHRRAGNRKRNVIKTAERPAGPVGRVFRRKRSMLPCNSYVFQLTLPNEKFFIGPGPVSDPDVRCMTTTAINATLQVVVIVVLVVVVVVVVVVADRLQLQAQTENKPDQEERTQTKATRTQRRRHNRNEERSRRTKKKQETRRGQH
jgi:mannitol-specific phosphotransferase system IIBC component